MAAPVELPSLELAAQSVAYVLYPNSMYRHEGAATTSLTRHDKTPQKSQNKPNRYHSRYFHAIKSPK